MTLLQYNHDAASWRDRESTAYLPIIFEYTGILSHGRNILRGQHVQLLRRCIMIVIGQAIEQFERLRSTQRQNEAAGTITCMVHTMPPLLGGGHGFGRPRRTNEIPDLEIRVLYSEIVEGGREFDRVDDIAMLDVYDCQWIWRLDCNAKWWVNNSICNPPSDHGLGLRRARLEPSLAW
ncbi:hypothetical protein HYPSUDRAFT_518476 [Hypholoma sublateritium FD-334 SS-4]|uniref:Uncharacterized protein n=1 Tax=Hypholoma sublateritium (strain FD-334 SS-4) TaxID=945553 RepID=A0A0D2LMW9_HYPSF|nr:hypothetical protein HYPSUDRAFT_518476 [Hypholoma sublateritium FD-334 SS-4]